MAQTPRRSLGGTDEEKGGNTKKRETQSVEEIINKIGDKPSCVMLMIFTAAMSLSMVGCYDAYMIAFTGIMPEYYCQTQQCSNMRAKYSASDELDVKDVLCKENLQEGVDYRFDTNRTTLVLDFDLYCSPGKLNLLSSYYFLGGAIGLFVGMGAFDVVGRRRSCIIGSLINLLATFLGLFCNSYGFMVGIRIVQGFGQFTSYASCYIWVLEFVPAKYRNYYNSWSMLIWATGYPGLVLVSYVIHDWRYIHLAACGVFILTYIPLFILPNSPRYLLSVGQTKQAKMVLEGYASILGEELDLSEVTVTIGDVDSKETLGGLTVKHKIWTFWEHKALLIETVVLFWGWFVACLLFYGLNYGWGSFGDTPYVNYLYVAMGETLAYLILIAVTRYLGRRFGMIFCYGGAAVCFVIGMVDWKWTELWSLERLVSIIAIVLISCAFALIFLYTGELAPTTHRGAIFSSSSLCARAAGFLGPFVKDVSKDSRIRLAICTALAGTAAISFFFEPETRGRPIPGKAEDVTARRNDQNLNSCTGATKPASG